MLHYKVGDLTEATEDIIAHGCNSKGVMGAGVAKAIKEKIPEAYETYRHHHRIRGLQLGAVVWAHRPSGQLVANCITQADYGNEPGRVYVDYKALRSCMSEIKQAAAAYSRAVTVAMPKIGAGLGGGDWQRIEKIIRRRLLYAPTAPRTNISDVTIYVLDESEIPHQNDHIGK